MLQVKDTAVRQVVVRIKSSQSLVKTKRNPYTGEEAVVGGTDKEKTIDEYLVMQRRIWKGREEGWMIWGTIEEFNVKDIPS
jgi:protein MBA1